MLWVAMAWIYVAGMMALVEASSPRGSLLGALITFTLYGLLPLSIVLYLMSAPARRRMRQRREAADVAGAASAAAASGAAGHGREHAARAAVAPEREET